MPQRKNNKLLPPAKLPPPPAKPIFNPQQQVSQSPSMMDSIKHGFSFGIGSSIAHNMVNKIFNSNDKPSTDKPHIDKPSIDKPSIDKSSIDKMYELYNKCLEKNDNNVNCSDILEKI
jgi:hypothetical protein